MKRSLKIPSFHEAKIKLFDLSGGMNGEVDSFLSSLDNAELTFNFDLSDGALKDGIGLKEFSYPFEALEIFPLLPNGRAPQKCYFYKRYDVTNDKSDDRLLCFASDNNVYECKLFDDEPTMQLVSSLSFSAAPNAVNYKFNGDDVIIFSLGETMKVYDGESVVEISNVPNITSMCLHNERLFVTTGGEQTSLWFSDDFDPTDFYVSLDKAGFIDFQDGRGRLLKVLSFNNYVYVFRNYGITRVSAVGSQREFSASGLFLGSGRIYKNAIVECGNRIVYLAEDGFYSFDGFNSARILQKYDKYLCGINNDEAVGKYFNGKIYIAVKMKIDARAEKVLIVYDTKNGSSYVAKGHRIKDIEIVGSNEWNKLVLISDTSKKIGTLSNDARVFYRPLKKFWQSNFSDFNIGKDKIFKKITLYATKPIVVKVESENGEKTISFSGKEYLQSALVGLRGKNFRISISAMETKTSVSKATIYFDYF